MTPLTYDAAQARLADLRRKAAARNGTATPQRGVTFSNTVQIARPPDEVFAYVADFTNVPAWNYYVTQVRRIDDSPLGVGTTYLQQRRSDSQRYRITDYQPPHTLAVQTITGDTPAFTRTFHLRPTPDGTTELVDTWTLDTGHPAPLQRMASATVRAAVADNLGRLKQLLETGSTRLQDGRTTAVGGKAEPAPLRREDATRRSLRKTAGRATRNLAIALLILMLVGASYETIAARNDAAAHPPPGELVDIGVYRTHLHCTGTGAPTVVLAAGLASTSLTWADVQPAIAQHARVCSWDRPGYGWSDRGPTPRTFSRIADELHRTLDAAGETAPYVLIGHSIGGRTARLFADRYPDDVVGAVLVDAAPDTDHVPVAQRLSLAITDGLRRVGVIRAFGRWLIPATTPGRPLEPS